MCYFHVASQIISYVDNNVSQSFFSKTNRKFQLIYIICIIRRVSQPVRVPDCPAVGLV